MANNDKKKAKIADLLPKDEYDTDDAELLAKLTGDDGKLKVDLTMPEDYLNNILAIQMADNIASYEQARMAWRSARNQPDSSRAKQLFEQMNLNQLTVAIIQANHPTVKKLANEIMLVRAKQAADNRKEILAKQ